LTTSPALDRFFQDYFPLIQGKCARMLGDSDEAMDVAQETFVRLWSSPLVYDTPVARLAWIYRTSTRLAIDYLRRRPNACG
jgi:RNA polymerase sigma-70 factor (ECF subfamily)